MADNDMDILRRAYERENDSRNRGRVWSAFNIRAARADINRLSAEGLIVQTNMSSRLGNYDYGPALYKLTEKGRGLVASTVMEKQRAIIPAATIIEAMDLIVGFQDLKQAIAYTIETGRKVHYLLEGPPACAKSLVLEGVRSSVPDSYPIFGSRTSAAGLSEALFEHQPRILLMDEADKIRQDSYSVMLGLMESGEILETKSGKTRGIHLDTMVIAACNSSNKMPPEFISRFALHAFFPRYTRDEFIDVCLGFLTRAQGCSKDIAQLIGAIIYDNSLGDVRRARGVWDLMTDSTVEEVRRVTQLMMKYSKDNQKKRSKAVSGSRLPGV